MKMSTITGIDHPIEITSLLVKFKLVSALTNATAVNDKALHVLAKGDFTVPIQIDSKDLNGQTKGSRFS